VSAFSAKKSDDKQDLILFRSKSFGSLGGYVYGWSLIESLSSILSGHSNSRAQANLCTNR
jgi:hypothetical protein